MADEEKLEEVSTASPEETAAPSTSEPESQPDIQKELDGNRRSIKDTLRAAIDEHKREPSPKRQAAAKERPHAPDGKFLPKEEKEGRTLREDSPAEAERPIKAETQPPTEKPVDVAPASKPAVEPPTSWSLEAKTAYTSLPQAVQMAIQKREKEVADGFTQYQTRYQDIDRAFGPQRDFQLQQLGKSRGEAISQLFGWHDALANPQTRVQAFRALMQSHGIDPSTLFPQTGQTQQPDPNTDPTAFVNQIVQSNLQQSLQPVLQRVGSFEQMLQQREELAEAKGKLTTFSTDKPHFERVRQAMAQMIGSGYAQDLEDAYQKATWADPEIRGEILAGEQAKREADAKAAQEAREAKTAQAEEERKRKEREAADKARRANIGVRHSTAAGMPSKSSGSKSIRDSIVEAVRDARG